MTDKIWGPVAELDLSKVMRRQVKFAQYLENRGIPTSPVTGRYCEEFTENCFDKYNTPSEKPEKGFKTVTE
jgi:hypothetical protein